MIQSFASRCKTEVAKWKAFESKSGRLAATPLWKPAVSSSWGGLRRFGRFLGVEKHAAAQVARIVEIEALLQSRVEARELAGEDVRRQARQLRQLKVELEQKV